MRALLRLWRVVPGLLARRAQARYRRRLAGQKLLRAFAEAYPQARFVEIGSNDGAHHDHLRPFIVSRRWSGVMVEPVPYVFERLKRNYGEMDSVTLVNAAIADRNEPRAFHNLSEAPEEERAALPDWYDSIGSFSRETVLRHARDIPDVERRLVTMEVPCLTFASLCERHRIERVDLVVIDTEGHDWEIIRNMDLAALRPRLLVFEHYHLSPQDRARVREHVEALGYDTLEEGFDTFCLDTALDDGVTRSFARLRPAIAALSVHDELER